MLKNLFNSADDRSAKPHETEQQPMFNPDRATMTSNTAKQQLLAILQDAQHKLEGNNSSATEPLRQNLRRARELAGFLSAPTPIIDSEHIHHISNQIRQASTSNLALDVAVTNIKSLLNADRVLVYELTGASTGKVVAEAVQTGFTPTIGEEIPQIGFGFEQQPMQWKNQGKKPDK